MPRPFDWTLATLPLVLRCELRWVFKPQLPQTRQSTAWLRSRFWPCSPLRPLRESTLQPNRNEASTIYNGCSQNDETQCLKVSNDTHFATWTYSKYNTANMDWTKQVSLLITFVIASQNDTEQLFHSTWCRAWTSWQGNIAGDTLKNWACSCHDQAPRTWQNRGADEGAKWILYFIYIFKK